MVKNTGGGKYAKKQASKHSNNTRAEELRKSQSPDEVYACVSQNFGNRLDVITIDGETLNCRMGGKFTGRKKRDNIVVKGSWVLVGLYDWEKEAKKCELLCIYDKYNIDELRNLPGYNWKYLLNASKNNDDDDADADADDATGAHVGSTDFWIKVGRDDTLGRRQNGCAGEARGSLRQRVHDGVNG